MLFTNYMHSQKYLFHQIVDEIYKNTLHKFETCMSSMHMRYKANQIDDSIPFVRTHIEPMFAPSGPVRAPFAPGLRLCSAPPCKVGACARPFEGRRFSRFCGSGLLRPFFSSARPRPHRSPELSPAVPLRPCPRPKTHNMEPAQHDDGPKS